MQQNLFDFAAPAATAKEPGYGTDPRALARRDSPSTSHAAAGKVDATKLEAMVHRAIHAVPDGCTASDLLDYFGSFAYSSITARFSALERKGFISCGPDKRPGNSGRMQRVMRSLKQP